MMFQFKVLLLVVLGLFSLFGYAEEYIMPTDTEKAATANKEVSADDAVRLAELALTPEQVAKRQREVATAQTALQAECKAFQAQMVTIREQFDIFEVSGIATSELTNEADKNKELADTQVEKVRLERQTVQTQLDKRRAYVEELKTAVTKYKDIAPEKQTHVGAWEEEQRIQGLQKTEALISLQQQYIALEEQYLKILEKRATMAIKNALLATQWHGRLQESYNNQLVKERQQGLSIAEVATAQQEKTLLKIQEELPGLLASLESAQIMATTLSELFEKSVVAQDSAEIEAKNLKLERQGIELNIERQTKTIENLTKDLDKLRQTPPVEPEQAELQDQRVANFDNYVKLQKKMLDLEEKYLQVVSQRIKQAEKRVALATNQQEKVKPVLQARQEQELDAKLQEEQQRYLTQATDLRWQLNKIPAEQVIQRYLLEVQIQQANELSQRIMRQREVQLIEQQLEKFKKTVSDQEKAKLSATQLKVLQEGVDELKTLLQRIHDSQELLKDKRVTLEKQQKTVEKRKELLVKEQEEAKNQPEIPANSVIGQQEELGATTTKPKADSTTQPQKTPVAERLKQNEATQKVLISLKEAVQEESEKLPLLLKQGEELLTVLEEVYRKSLQRSLSSRRQLPTTMSEWQVLFGEVQTFPQLFLQQFQLFFGDFKQAFQQAGQQRWFMIGAFTLLWLGVIALGKMWNRRFQKQMSLLKAKQSSLISQFSLGLQLIQMNLWSITILILFLVISWLIQPNPVSFLAGLDLLVLILGSKFLINLARLLLSSTQNLQNQFAVYRRLRRIVVFLAIFAIIVTLIHQKHDGLTIRLALTTEDFIDTLFMLSLAFTIRPVWQLRRIILSSMQQMGRNHWLAIIRFVTALLLLSILIIATLGVIGYMNLSWLVTQQITLFLLVLTGWLVIRGFLGDFVIVWRNRLAKMEGYGALWSEDIIPLIHKVIGLILFVIAVFVLLKISGWYSDTAFRQGIVDLWNFSLFIIGSTHVTIGNILMSAFLLWVVLWLGGWSRGVSYRWAYAGIIDSGVRHSLSVFTEYAVITLGLLIVLKTIGIDPTMLTVFAGAIGVGIGFGMQNVVNNFISGILLLIERPLKTGDVVDIGVYKEVIVGQIGIRSTTVKMPDKKELIVPNAEIISQSFVNWTREDMLLRIVSYIGVGYDDDLRLVEKILLEIMGEITGILRDPPFRILLWEFEESRITIRIEYHVDMSRGSYERIKSDMKFKIWERFREAGIKIPYPQRDVHLKPQPLKEDLLLQDELIVLPQTGGKT